MDSSYASGLVALAGGSQIGATPINRTFSRFTTVANAGDSAVLPTATPCLAFTVVNAGANSMNVFPSLVANLVTQNPSSDQINSLGTATAFALPAGKTVQLVCVANGYWNTILSA